MTGKTFDEWQRENTLEYRGYFIGPGAIYRDGEAVIVTADRLGADREEVFASGQAIIDQLLDPMA